MLGAGLLCLPVGATGGQSWAVLVGVNDYQDSTIGDLTACESSVQRIQELLVRRFGFDPDRMVVLLGKDATREAVVKALKEHLADRADRGEIGPDDVVVFYYSGHGSFLPDVSGDEPDGKDETICPWDTRKMTASELQLEGAELPNFNQITDDELNGYFKTIAARTPNLTVVLDSCHSGTGTRAVGALRKTLDVRYDTETMEVLDRYVAALPGPRSATRGAPGGSGLGDEGGNGGWTALSACQAHQQAFQYDENVTFLTRFLADELEHAGPTTTYRALMDKVRYRVQNENLLAVQTPTLEEQEPHYVFAGTAPKQPAYFLATSAGGAPVLKAGAAHGVSSGSEFELYPPATQWAEEGQASAPLLGRYRVAMVTPLESKLEPLDGAPSTFDVGSRALEVAHGFDRFVVAVWVEPEAAAAVKDLEQLFSSATHVAQAPSREEACYRLSINDQGLLQVDSLAGEPLEQVPPRSPAEAALLLHDVNQLARFQQVVQLENPAPQLAGAYKVTVRRGKKTDAGVVPDGPAIEPDESGNYVVPAGSYVVLEMKNRRREKDPLFLNILYLSPDVTAMKTSTGETRDVRFLVRRFLQDPVALEGGKSEQAGTVGAKLKGDSGDQATLKVFITTSDTDLSVLEQGGITQKTRGSGNNALQRLLDRAAEGKRSRAPVATSKVEDWDVLTLPLRWE